MDNPKLFCDCGESEYWCQHGCQMGESRTSSGQCCEVLRAGSITPRYCGKPAVLRYGARGGGYMHLCAAHGMPHRPYCERWNGQAWEPRAIGVDGGAQGDTHA